MHLLQRGVDCANMAPHAPGSEQQQAAATALRDDVRELGELLGNIIKLHGQDGDFERVEEMRALAKQRRADASAPRGQLQRLVHDLDLDEISSMLNAFSTFLDVANLCEDNQRIRILRQRAKQTSKIDHESLASVMKLWKEQGCTADIARDRLASLSVELVGTAHPTEAKRRTVRRVIQRIKDRLRRIERVDLLPSEIEEIQSRIRADLLALWACDGLPPQRPSVLSEVDRNLFVLEALWTVAPRSIDLLRRAFAQAWPGEQLGSAPVLAVGTWMGGDRDGNPNVTAEITQETLVRLRAFAIKCHRGLCQDLTDRMAETLPSDVAIDLLSELNCALSDDPILAQRCADDHEHDVPRRWLRLIDRRLEKTAEDDAECIYKSSGDLRHDIQRLVDALMQCGLQEHVDLWIRPWLDRVDIFGLHLARLDIRESSEVLAEAVADAMRSLNIEENYLELDEAARQTALEKPIDVVLAKSLDVELFHGLSRETHRLASFLQSPKQHEEALGVFVISMTRKPSDVLSPNWLMRLAAMRLGTEPVAISVSPLFETVDDLAEAPRTLKSLLKNEAYLKDLHAAGGVQTCMVGYSDSTKDSGIIAANWHLYLAQEQLSEVADEEKIPLVLFHGRGGSLGRGGGPAARGILSLPPGTMRGEIRLTEQGEVLADRYDDHEIAERHLAQVLSATARTMVQPKKKRPARWSALMTEAAQAGRLSYRNLIENPHFIEWFDLATPISVIETLTIGSRPSRRKQERTLQTLRAIPYTFAMTQNRSMVTGFYGFGSGIEACGPEAIQEFREMMQDWPFFDAHLRSVEIALAKASIDVTRAYSDLAAESGYEGVSEIDELISAEYERSRRVVLAITGQSSLLESTPWLARSIEVRNLYVDPLNAIQIELLRRSRSIGQTELPAGDVLADALRRSVQAVASGMRTTG